MMLGLGPTELIIILVIIIIVFGVGRISKIGGELGSGIKAFKEGLGGDEEEEADAEAEADVESEEK
ncbi:MAG: twin-arginine translocase TatA/TatE family subunit [Anaerolineales bacterium]|nr:twin-arginine translocase TatA/TatE family subunit [Anaerolineales bacterium]